MPVFEYAARNGAGAVVRGRAASQDASELASLLRRQGLYLTFAKPAELSTAGKVALRLGELADFAHHMGTLLGAGLVVSSALQAVEEHAEDASLRKFTQAVRERVEDGQPISDAMASVGEALPALYIAVVRSGELTGRLDSAFQRLSAYLERELEFRRRVREALAYPAVVLAAAVVVVTVFLTYVVPAFERVYRTAGAQLPPLTQLVMATARLVRSALPAGAFLAALAAIPLVRRGGWGRVWSVWRPVLERAPRLGGLVRTAQAARFLQGLGQALVSGVPLLSALPAAAGAAGKPQWADVLAARVERGGRLSEALRGLEGFPAVAVRLLALGDESGQVGEMALRAAEVLDREFERSVKRLLAALEPALTVVLAAIVGALLLALYMPIFTLGRAVLSR